MHRIPFRPLRTAASRIGHDAVWVAIAGLFYIVEGAVKVTELVPTKPRRTGAAAVTGKVALPASAGSRRSWA